MSDSKWCRLLAAIAAVHLPVSYWRFLESGREYRIPTPNPDQIIEHEGRRGIGDCHALGPFFFRDVDSVRWPASYSHYDWCRGLDPVVERQPITNLSAAIDRCGKFDYEVDEDGLILDAHRRPGRANLD